MNTRKFQMHDAKSGSAITVRVTPRSGRTMISGIMEDGTIKIRLAAAPVDGSANQELLRYLAEILEIRENQLEIISGMTGRDKLITILGLASTEVEERIRRHVKE